MKRIKIRHNDPQNNTVGILRIVVTNSPHTPLNVDQIRRRVKILDVLDSIELDSEHFILEDEDAKVLCAAIETFPWASANKQLLQIIDDVLSAETEPHPMKLVASQSNKKEKPDA